MLGPPALLPSSPALLFGLGLVVVLVGAELLLRGASRLAARWRVSPILIGLTVVSVGTSTPELAVGITAVHEGRGPLAVGNIAGTNIVNILLILGLSALIRPLPTRALSIRLDVPVMIACALALVLMAMDGVLRPNRRSPDPRLYAAKALDYQRRWPWLTVLDTVSEEPARPIFMHQIGF